MKLRDFMIAFGGLPNLLAVADEVIEWRRCLLHCMSPFMVHFGLGAMSGLSPQCGQQRTFRLAASKATPPPQSP
jgi:hypothetical protein